MTCVGPKNQNPFSLLASFNPPPPNELSQVLPQRNSCGKSTPRDPAIKLQRHADQRCDLQQPCTPVSRQNGFNKPRPAYVCTSLSSLQSPHAHIGSRHEIGIMLCVKTNHTTVTPPHYLPDFKTNQSSLEWHHRDSVNRRPGEPFRPLLQSNFVESPQTMF
jgi:hypothetical protein